ncbi:MAG: hypothetical protein JWQ49_3229 [Edaphobacter sp.]|nr:hypothetical protein [Edaphobacter sp.]
MNSPLFNPPANSLRPGDGDRRGLRLILLLLLSLGVAGTARGEVALLVEEPYGFFGSINPTGHSAIYLNRVCAESPTVLRRCRPGETGVVISRYSRIRKFDWVAIPLLPYLYAVEQAQDVPQWAEAASVTQLRKAYAEAHLTSLVSATKGYDTKNVWPQLLGVAYIRKIYSFEIATTAEQDDRLIAEYNDRANQSHFNLFTNNCADFSRRLLNFYYPHAVGRSITADIAITTPKQIAKSLATYAHRHDELELSEVVIPQVPGTIPRSHTPRGVVESLLKTKKYAVPIAVFHPYFLAGIAVTYLTNGRFNFEKNAPEIPVTEQEQTLVSGNSDGPLKARDSPSPLPRLSGCMDNPTQKPFFREIDQSVCSSEVVPTEISVGSLEWTDREF